MKHNQIEKLEGTRQDMINLSALIGQHVKKQQELEYIPKDFMCEVRFSLWPNKAFTIIMYDKKKNSRATIPFISDIQEFGETTEKAIEELVLSLENKLITEP